MNWLHYKNVIISGASSGIGKEISKILINKFECKVLGLARNKQKLEQTKAEIGNNFDFFCMDVSQQQDWQNLKSYLLSCNFQPDILINNAGTMTPFLCFEKCEEKDVKRVFETNFFSVTYAIQQLLPVLLKSKSPAIVNVSSAASLCCMPGVSIYSASKSALKTFSEILHCELKKRVYVCTIMPGFTKTNLFSSKDNKTNVFQENDLKIVNKFSMSAKKMASKIVKTIKKRKARAIIGIDAKFLNYSYKLTPQTSGKFLGFVMKKSKMDSFKNI